MGQHSERLRRKVLKQPPQITSEAMFYSAIDQILNCTTLSGFQVVGILNHFAARTNLQIFQMQQKEDERVSDAEDDAKAEEARKAKEEYGSKHV